MYELTTQNFQTLWDLFNVTNFYVTDISHTIGYLKIWFSDNALLLNRGVLTYITLIVRDLFVNVVVSENLID